MAISNEQYRSIMRNYEATQLRNHHIVDMRKEEIISTIPEYASIDHEIASLSVKRCKQMLMGDDSTLEQLKTEIKTLSQRKKELLTKNGYAVDYLDPIYSCPDCQDTGYLPDNQKCHCFKQKIITLLYEQSHIREVLDKENFSTLSTEYYVGEDLANYRQILDKCYKFVSDFKSTYQNIFFYGTVGTGKSFLSNCIAKELIENGYSVLYFSATQLFDTLSQYAFRRNESEDSNDFHSDLYDCDLLIIDDLGSECTNRFINTELFHLINERTLRQKSVIISSNLQLADLTDRYSERIFSRITSNYQLLKLTGSDIRIQQKLSHRK